MIDKYKTAKRILSGEYLSESLASADRRALNSYVDHLKAKLIIERESKRRLIDSGIKLLSPGECLSDMKNFSGRLVWYKHSSEYLQILYRESGRCDIAPKCNE